MEYAPIARIILRRLDALLFGWGVIGAPGGEWVTDPDVVAAAAMILAAIVGAATETWYVKAKAKGGAT